MDRWCFLEATPDERALFASLSRTLAVPHEPAAPPNRWRHVKRLETEAGTYYLKCFVRTQPKNRLRFALTAPRCGSDGEREALVTRALRARGVATPRPVAVGRHGASWYYLCAALDGAPLRTQLAAGPPPRPLLRAAARFAGRLTAHGVVLPDLSADHVWALADGTFAVLDLHNGRLARRPTARDARRVLRHFGRSVRGAPVPRRAALGFATGLLRAMGLDRAQRRAQVRGQPPWDTHSRYDAAGKSEAYRTRNPRRHARELACLARVWPGRPGERVLDSPCGAGRILGWLGERGARPVGADRAAAMLQQARSAAPSAPLAQADSTELPFADRSCDGVVVFRFLHHLPPERARAALAEACRVADRFVVVTFFHPVSAHGLRRRLTDRLRGRAPTRFSMRPATLTAWCVEQGFVPSRASGEAPYRRELWVAAFERRPSRPA